MRSRQRRFCRPALCNDEWGSITKYTMMLAGLILDVSAAMSALVAVIVQCFTFERRLCGRPCRWRLSRRDDEWERACGAPCGRSCSHRADVPHCCPQHGTCDEETLIERMIHQWILVQDAGVVAWKRAKATWASWWAIKAMLVLLIAKLVVTINTSSAHLPASARAGLHAHAGEWVPQAGVRLRWIEAGARHVRFGIIPQRHQ